MGYPYIKSPLESESDQNLIAEKLLKLGFSHFLDLRRSYCYRDFYEKTDFNFSNDIFDWLF